MTITEQITSQIDDVVQSISNYSNDVLTENQRTNKVKSDAATRYAAQKSQIKQQTDVQIQSFIDARRTVDNDLNMSQQEVSTFEQELEHLIPRNRVNNIPTVNDKFSADDARALIARIQETGFWAWIKKLFALGNYSSNTNMAAELYGKIDNAYQYFRNEHDFEEKKCKDKIGNCEESAKKRMVAIDAQYQQDIQNENNVHSIKVRALAQQEQKLSTDPRILAVQKQLAKARDVLGVSTDDWQTYAPAKFLPDDLLIGVILWPCKIGSPTPEACRLLKKFPNYVPSVNGFTVPLTVPMKKPVLMYAECEAGDVKFAASIYQSIIARMIRFMPPKSLRSAFFDPVGRSTSLGQLIHLTGEGTSQACEYHLSPQDINTHMSKLTEHVDKVCRRLTSAGCSDINTYNSIPKVARIPYTAVVIHDYPNGFDSTSLEYLQVLINKADQCGISIMVSHKKDDKIEHKALEVFNLINQRFDRVYITAQAKAQIAKGENIYSYKPNIVNMSKGYLDEINKLFTYKPPIDNSFSKFFGGKQLAYRDSKEGLDIPFAVDASGAVVDLKIGYDLSAYGFISGGVGSGKTTLLHMIMTSAIMHYSPSDLELWVVDFKVAEFAFYARNCPPHIRYVVADSSSEFAYSIMDEIEEEIKRRQKAFVNANVKDYVAYCESTYGKTHNLPRILIVIDEFHRMAQVAQEETAYKIILENIISEARSHGIILLLCSQQISNGLAGLSQKSRDLISVRIALRNKADEIRETLAAENTLITDDVKKMILDTTSAVGGSGIYKYEVKKDEFSNKVIFMNCRGIYATQEIRTDVITELSKKHSNFKRDKSFFIGAARQHMDVKQIKSFENNYPQPPDVGERFYIGTPLGIQPCFYFNLKPAQSGENVLLVGNNQEKRIAILKSILSCAGRYGYIIKILASKAAQLYRQNKDFFNSLTQAEVITSFPEICKFVGENANRLKSMYSDDEDFEIEAANDKELVIFIGLDEIYAQMEANPLSQKSAWTVFTPATGTPATLAVITPAPSITSNSVSLSTQTTEVETVSVPDTIDEGLAAGISRIDNLLASLDDDDDSPVSATLSVPEKFSGTSSSGIKGYNAIHDLAVFFSDGWKIGINSMVVVDRGTVFGKMRQVKLDGNFNHRIALVMSPEEAQGFMAKTKTMKALIDANDSISAVYEYLGGREQCFRPYVFD
ncbi:MAG: hypothetical protein E7286_07470 [Lachnospiraceae bacterium]|nr:hypothetical protein [Lachnospiraceae bacterium]